MDRMTRSEWFDRRGSGMIAGMQVEQVMRLAPRTPFAERNATTLYTAAMLLLAVLMRFLLA